MTEANWFLADLSEYSATRALLDLGLRSADQHFRELVVPGIGSVWFVRQLSWTTAAIRMVEHHGVKSFTKTDAAHAIEALACKAEYLHDKESLRIRGKRAFDKDPDGNVTRSAAALVKPGSYVSTTFRQGTTRALTSLGLATGGRFRQFCLTPAGASLADEILKGSGFGSGNRNLASSLKGWFDDSTASGWQWNSVQRALSPNSPTKSERDIVAGRLFNVMEDNASKKRTVLRDIFEGKKTFPDPDLVVGPALKARGELNQANELSLARAFGNFFDGALTVVRGTTRLLANVNMVSADKLANQDPVAEAIEELKLRAQTFRDHPLCTQYGHVDARHFATMVTSLSGAGIILDLATRDGRILQRLDASVARGDLFRVIGAEAMTEEAGNEPQDPENMQNFGRTFGLSQLFELCGDIYRD